MFYENIIRPILFQLDPEIAHNWTIKTLSLSGSIIPSFCHTNPHTKPTSLMGLNLPNPIGLAAGLDKNGEAIDALAAMGFGFIEVGTVTPRPQDGNPKPRLFRSPEHHAIVNRMGFNNQGIDTLIANIKRSHYTGILGINIGKNATTPIENAADDYLICLEKSYPYADYITINISSPNTQNLRTLQGSDELSQLLCYLKNKQTQLEAEYRRYVPLAVKIAPDLDEAQITNIAHILIQMEMDGVIATNTTIDKSSLGASSLVSESGGLSGEPVRAKSNQVLSQLNTELGGKIPIIGAGGVMSGTDATEKIRLGANAVQIFSGLIYRGTGLVSECLEACR